MRTRNLINQDKILFLFSCCPNNPRLLLRKLPPVLWFRIMFYKNCFETLFLFLFRRYRRNRLQCPWSRGEISVGNIPFSIWQWDFYLKSTKSFCKSPVFFSWPFLPLISSQGVFTLREDGFLKTKLLWKVWPNSSCGFCVR